MIGVTIICSIAALFVVAAILAFTSIDTLIRGAVEEVGSNITKTKVKLNSVSTNLNAGTAYLSGLTLGNPSGFYTAHAFKLDAITATMDTRTVRSTFNRHVAGQAVPGGTRYAPRCV